MQKTTVNIIPKKKNSVPLLADEGKNSQPAILSDFMSGKLGMMSSAISRTHAAIEKLNDIVSEQQSRINAIMQCVDDGMVVLNQDGDIIIQNELGRKLFKELCTCHETQFCRLHKFIGQLNSGSTTLIEEFIQNGGTYRLHGKKIFDTEENFKLALRIKGQSETDSLQHLDMEENGLPWITEMTAAVAHEINNPLTPILGLISAAISNEQTDIPVKHLVKMHQSGKRIAEVVHHLLQFNQAPKWGIIKQLSPGEMMTTVFTEIEPELKAQDIQFVQERPDNVPSMEINVMQVQQILIYLLRDICLSMNSTGVGDKILMSFEWNNSVGIFKLIHNGPSFTDLEEAKAVTSENFRSLLALFAHIMAKNNRIKIRFNTPEGNQQQVSVEVPWHFNI